MLIKHEMLRPTSVYVSKIYTISKAHTHTHILTHIGGLGGIKHQQSRDHAKTHINLYVCTMCAHLYVLYAYVCVAQSAAVSGFGL